MGNMMADGVIPSRHNEKKNKNEKSGSWKMNRRSEALPQWVQLRRPRKRRRRRVLGGSGVDASGSAAEAGGREMEAGQSVPLQVEAQEVFVSTLGLNVSCSCVICFSATDSFHFFLAYLFILELFVVRVRFVPMVLKLFTSRPRSSSNIELSSDAAHFCI